MTKSELRHWAQLRRGALSPENRRTQELVIQQRLGEILRPTQGPIHCYVSFGSEVDTQRLIGQWLSESRPVICPRMRSRTELSHHWMADLSDLELNSRGILEPKAHCPLAQPEAAEWIMIPGLAFSKLGQRLGYGAGYYDRFLQTCGSFKMGLAFEEQIVDQLPMEPHDVPMDGLLSQGQFRKFTT